MFHCYNNNNNNNENNNNNNKFEVILTVHRRYMWK